MIAGTGWAPNAGGCLKEDRMTDLAYTLIRHPTKDGWTYDDGTPHCPSRMALRKAHATFMDVAIWLTLHREAHWWQIVVPMRQEKR